MTVAASTHLTVQTSVGHVSGTTPYSWPWNADLSPAGTAVLVVDAPGVSAEGSESVNAAAVVERLRSVGVLAIRVSTRTRREAPLSEQGTWVPVDLAVQSAGVDGFYGSPLEALLRSRGIERLLLVGAWIETSVHSTMRTANDQGFECLLIVDACSPADPALTPQSISMIEMSGGIFGAVGYAEAVLTAFGL